MNFTYILKYMSDLRNVPILQWCKAYHMFLDVQQKCLYFWWLVSNQQLRSVFVLKQDTAESNDILLDTDRSMPKTKMPTLESVNLYST